MKSPFAIRFGFTILLAAGALLSRTAVAQPGPGATPGSQPGGVDAALFHFFGDTKEFSAKANMKMEGQQKISMVINFALRDGKVRTEVDLTQVKSAELPADAMAAMKQMGMDRMVTLMDSGKKSICLIYPGLKSYTQMPIPKEQAATLDQKPKIEKTALGKETIDGHPCVKNKVVVTGGDGKTQEAIVWNASDLKDFPVQLEMAHEGNKTTLRYQDIRLAAPDAKLFETPAGFTKYESVQALMQGAMMKLLGGQN